MEKHTPSLILLKVSQFFKLSKLTDIRKLNVTVSKCEFESGFVLSNLYRNHVRVKVDVTSQFI